MLPRTTHRMPRRAHLFLGALLAGAILSTTGPARAEAVKTGTALSLVPADTAFFSTMLRNKEQIDLFYKSNAYKTIRALPFVEMGHKHVMAELAKEGGPASMAKKLLEDPDNKELLAVLIEAVSDEVFIYGSKNWVSLLEVAGKVNNAQQWAPLMALVSGGDPSKAQVRAILTALQKDHAKLKVPELVIGFKVKDAKKVDAQIARLEKLGAALLDQVPPLKGKLKRAKVGDGNLLTFEVDGSLIPWNDVDLKDIEEKKDEFEDLVKHAKKMTVSVSLGVKDGYLLLGISSTAGDLAQIGGKGKSLAERDEMQPLAKHEKKPLTGISFASKELIGAAGATRTDLVTMGKTLKDLLSKVDVVKEPRKKAIAKDLDSLVDELTKALPEYGSRLAFSYLTETGFEGYSYDFGKYDSLKDVASKLQNHFGGDPIFAAAFAGKADGKAYGTLSKWVGTIYGHAEAVFMDNAPEEAQQQYKKVAKVILPLIGKLDETTKKMLIPALKETGLGFVLDAKWSSKQWHNQMPAMEKAMPLLELGLLVGISDARLFEKAMTEYRKTLNELFEKVKENAPGDNIPEIKLPAPQKDKGKAGLLFYYALPEEAGLDKQIQPVMGIGSNVSVLALGKAHAERLMGTSSLKYKSGPLSRKGNLLGVCVFNWPALVDAVTPWVDFGVKSSMIYRAGDEDGARKAKMTADAIMKQVKVGLTVLKCFTGASSATYVEDGKLVTHTEILIKDLDKVIKAKE